PEQLEGGEISPATDIYALGLVIYEMVTGHRPFPDETPLAVALRRLKDAPPSPRVHAPELDPRWEAAILHCLAIDPAVRFQSAHQVSQALCGGGFAGGMSRQPASALAPQVRNPGSQAPGFARRRPVVTSVLAAIVLCLLVILSRLQPWKPGSLPEGATVILTD